MPAMPRPEENVRTEPGELQTHQDLSEHPEQERETPQLGTC